MMPPGTGGGFAVRLADMPPDRRITETFGWFPAAAALGAIFVILAKLAALVLGYDDFDEDALKLLGGCVAGAALFGLWEIWRRTRPTTLVVVGGQLGIYRHGNLESVVGFGQLTHYRLSIVNTVREVIAFGAIGLFGALAAMASIADGHVSAAFYSFAGIVVGAGGLASTLWSRAMCVHYWVPKGGGTETCVLKRGDLARLGWRI